MSLSWQVWKIKWFCADSWNDSCGVRAPCTKAVSLLQGPGSNSSQGPFAVSVQLHNHTEAKLLLLLLLLFEKKKISTNCTLSVTDFDKHGPEDAQWITLILVIRMNMMLETLWAYKRRLMMSTLWSINYTAKRVWLQQTEWRSDGKSF